MFDLVRPPVPDLLAILEVDPGQTMARIRSLGRPLLAYENARFLAELQSAYGAVSQVLKKKGGPTVMNLDCRSTTAEAVAEEIVEVARQFENGRVTAAQDA